MDPKPFAFSGKAMIRDRQGRYLLVRRSAASRYNAGKWDLPGGKADLGEDLDDALIREVQEETGLRVSLERVAGAAESETPVKKIAYLIFEAAAERGEVRLSEEHDDYVWVERAELPETDVAPQFLPFLRGFSAERPQGF